MVKQTTGRGREDFDAAAEHVALRADVHAAENHPDAKRGISGVLREVRRDLISEFAGGRQHQRTNGMTRRRHRRIGMAKHAGNQRQAEAGRFPGPGLRSTHHITALHHHGDGFRLNRRRLLVAHAVNSGKDARVEIELCERRHSAGVLSFGKWEASRGRIGWRAKGAV